jgi:hypothetical protein
VKRPLRGRFTASLILALIFSETLTASAFQKKSAQFSQKSSKSVGVEKVETPKAIPPFDFAQDGIAFGVSSSSAI